MSGQRAGSESAGKLPPGGAAEQLPAKGGEWACRPPGGSAQVQVSSHPSALLLCARHGSRYWDGEGDLGNDSCSSVTAGYLS